MNYEKEYFNDGSHDFNFIKFVSIPPTPPPVEVHSLIELSGLQYNKVKIEFSELHKNTSEFYVAVIRVEKPEALTGASVTINDVKITNYKTSVIDAIEAKKPILIHAADITKLNYHLDFEFLASSYENPLDWTPFSYRLKVDTDGLKVNKSLFDKKIEFTAKYGYYTKIDIDIANKKVEIKY